MDFGMIMSGITSGLTGNPEVDIEYLKEQMQKYQDHEMSREITRACSRLLFEMLPEDKKTELGKVLKKSMMDWNSTLEEVRFNRYKKDNKSALKLIESLVDSLESMTKDGMFENDAVSEYHCFNEFYEELLYLCLTNPGKDQRRPSDIPAAAIYAEYGSLLIDLDRVQDAQAALETAKRWNPVGCDIAFEYAETYKILGDFDTFFKLTLDGFKYAFRPAALARCYRNLGFYFVEKQLWQEAMACYLLSLQYDKESKNAQSELYYISSQTNGTVSEPGMEELKLISKKYGFPIGPTDDVVGIAFAYAKKMHEQHQSEPERYFLQIVYDLTEDECVGDALRAIPANPNETKQE